MTTAPEPTRRSCPPTASRTSPASWPRRRAASRRGILGTGTTLDSARLRRALASLLDADAGNVHAHVVGEHGDSSLVLWSAAAIGPVPLEAFPLPEGVTLGGPGRATSTGSEVAKATPTSPSDLVSAPTRGVPAIRHARGVLRASRGRRRRGGSATPCAVRRG
jgi:lactate/malate dehydrogenase, alpha/beta C-terminal domain